MHDCALGGEEGPSAPRVEHRYYAGNGINENFYKAIQSYTAHRATVEFICFIGGDPGKHGTEKRTDCKVTFLKVKFFTAAQSYVSHHLWVKLICFQKRGLLYKHGIRKRSAQKVIYHNKIFKAAQAYSTHRIKLKK